jgi:hypothetical protein
MLPSIPAQVLLNNRRAEINAIWIDGIFSGNFIYTESL